MVVNPAAACAASLPSMPSYTSRPWPPASCQQPCGGARGRGGRRRGRRRLSVGGAPARRRGRGRPAACGLRPAASLLPLPLRGGLTLTMGAIETASAPVPSVTRCVCCTSAARAATPRARAGPAARRRPLAVAPRARSRSIIEARSVRQWASRAAAVWREEGGRGCGGGVPRARLSFGNGTLAGARGIERGGMWPGGPRPRRRRAAHALAPHGRTRPGGLAAVQHSRPERGRRRRRAPRRGRAARCRAGRPAARPGASRWRHGRCAKRVAECRAGGGLGAEMEGADADLGPVRC
jgi:hypothetical protein